MNVKVLLHALRHGLGEEEIIYAWKSPIRCRQRISDDEPPRWIAVGILPNGKLVELVAFQDFDNRWNIFHAMAPPTKKFLDELELSGGKNGSN